MLSMRSCSSSAVASTHSANKLPQRSAKDLKELVIELVIEWGSAEWSVGWFPRRARGEAPARFTAQEALIHIS